MIPPSSIPVLDLDQYCLKSDRDIRSIQQTRDVLIDNVKILLQKNADLEAENANLKALLEEKAAPKSRKKSILKLKDPA